VEEGFADIPRLHPGVSEVIPVAWRRWRKELRDANTRANARREMAGFWRRLRAHSYDYILDSQGLIKSAIISRMARNPHMRRGRRGFSHTVAREPWAAFAYTQGYPIARGGHAVDRQRQLFAHALNYGASGEPDAGMRLRRAPTRQVVLLHGTTWTTKHWPEQMWCRLASLVETAGFEAVVTYGNEVEHQRGMAIAGQSGATLHPQVKLGRLSQLLSNAALVIGVDSGLTHLSAALGTPTFGLYGPTDGRLTGIRGLRSGYLQADLECAPCLSQSCDRYKGDPKLWQGKRVEPPCLAQLTPERVWAQACTLLDNTAAVG